MTGKSKHGAVHNKFIIDQGSAHLLKNKTLLLDTNALIDAYRLSTEFVALLDEFVTLGCDLTATRSVIIEFLGSTTDAQIIKGKAELIEMIFGKKLTSNTFYLPLDHKMPELETFLIFSRQVKNFSAIDFEIYRTMQKYRSHLLLVTRNHKDFSTKLVERISFITLLGTAEIHTYGVYKAI